MPFTLAQVVSPPRTPTDSVLISWWLPDTTPIVDFKKGSKKQVLDLFGPWRPLVRLTLAELRGTQMPETLVSQGAVLEMNVDLTVESELPFQTFDDLRQRHAIDTTALSFSLTKRGNVYRRYALLGSHASQA